MVNNELQNQLRAQSFPYITDIQNLSDGVMLRLRVNFVNGLGLSIITGRGSYGSNAKPYEIACFGVDGEFDKTLFDQEDRKRNSNDDVLGYCTTEKVVQYIKKLGKMSCVPVISIIGRHEEGMGMSLVALDDTKETLHDNNS